MEKPTLAVVLTGVLLLGGGALADTVTLSDGSVREGLVVGQDAQNITLEVRVGNLKATLVIPRREVVAIQTKPLPADVTETEAAQLRHAAEGLKGARLSEAWVKLGDLYSHALGYSAQAREAFEKAVQADPENAAAHARLGHVKTAAGWQPVDDERRARGLVPLGETWVKPEERTWLIDRRHEQQTEELRIGPRQPDVFTPAQVQRELALKALEEEAARGQRLQMGYGDSLLSRYGYYAPDGGYYIGAAGRPYWGGLPYRGGTPYWVDGVGLDTGDAGFFVGTVGTGPYPYWYPNYWDTRSFVSPWMSNRRGGDGHPGDGAGHPGDGHGAWHGQDGRATGHGSSPGFRWGNFSFGTNFGSDYPGYSWGSGWGASLHGGSGDFRYNLNLGGWGGSTTRGRTGTGW